MRMPWQQLATEVVEHGAADLAVLLGCAEEKAGWGVVKLIHWALLRCQEDAPPSSQSAVRGASAAKLIARAAKWTGDPEAFVDACTQLADPILERVEGGIRICGLRRYDAFWRKSYPAKAAAWRRAGSETGAEPAPDGTELDTETELNRSQSGSDVDPNRSRDGAEDGPKPARKSKIESKSKKEAVRTYVDQIGAVGGATLPVEAQRELTGDGPRHHVPRIVEAPDTPPESWVGEDFWRWTMAIRWARAKLPAERPPRPAALSNWWSAARALFETSVMQEAFLRFGDDPFWQQKTPPLPFSGFMAQWERFVPPEGPAAEPGRKCSGCGYDGETATVEGEPYCYANGCLTKALGRIPGDQPAEIRP